MSQEIINQLQQQVYKLTFELDNAIRRADYYKSEYEKVDDRLNICTEQLMKKSAKEEMYNLIITICDEHEMVKSTFMDFMMTLKLVDDTAEDKFKSIQRSSKWL